MRCKKKCQCNNCINKNFIPETINKNTMIPVPGVKGDTPYIGENGNWWISGVDTGVSAEGLPPTPSNETFIIL